ncbi:MAG: cyclic nucleotide-binding domain-containing protein, partial [Acidimicrobiia bacterium]
MPQSLDPPADAVDRLRRIRALAQLDDTTLDAIGREGEWLRIDAGELLFRENDRSDAAYFVLRGRVRVVQSEIDGGERVIGERGAGETIGEIGIVADLPRTASVRALRDTDVVRIARDAFDRLVESDPKAVVPLMRVIAERLAEATRGGGAGAGRVAVLAMVCGTHGD